MRESHPQSGPAAGGRRRRSAGAPGQVTLIGHNSQVVATAGFFVGSQVAVRVYTSSADQELALAPYPGVQVSVVDPGYGAAPADLPPPPYFVAVDDAETAARIRAWLPATAALFLVRGDSRRSRAEPGFLTLHPPQAAARDQVAGRLARLARLDRVLAPARGAQSALILMYGDPDPDAVGAALGLAALWRTAGCEARIRYTGEVHRYQNRLLLQYLKKAIEPLRADELAAADLVAVVDAQPGFWREDPPRAQVVIDHHPLMESTSASPATVIEVRPDYGATSTILTEMLLDAELAIDRRLATALLFGITTDTADLKRKTSSADIAAFEALHHLADRRLLERLEKSQIPATYLDVIAWGISHRVVYRDHLLVHFGQVRTPDVLVQAADLLLLTYGIGWVVCAGLVGRPRRLVAVFRGDGHGTDVGRRARDAFAELGSAGGHRTMARAELPWDDDRPIADTCDLLVERLFRRMRPSRSRTFIRTLRRHLEDERPNDPDEYELSC